MTAIHAVFFDLDGTLADTAPDLADSLNRLRQEQGREPLPFEQIRPHVSYGSPALIKLGFGLNPADDDYSRLRSRLLAIYAENICVATRPFEGTRELIRALSDRSIRWGVVTNKPAFLTEPLIEKLAFSPPPACVVSGDSTANHKPHPEPMLHACRLAGASPAQSVYVGDAERDIHSGQQAGMKTMVALFGYIRPQDQPATWHADAMIRAPLELLTYLDDWT